MPRPLCPSTLAPPTPTTIASADIPASLSASWIALWMHAESALGSASRPLFQPADSTSPCPRKRRRESSSMQITARVHALPPSSPTAYCGLEATMFSLHRGDAVIQSEIEVGRGRHFLHDARVVIDEIPQTRRKVMVAQHQHHRPAAHGLRDAQIVQVADVHFRNVV